MNATAIVGQLMVGLIDGSFYAMLSLGMAVIFGMLHIVNFAHGMLYMLGAFIAYLCLQHLGVNYWEALIIAPVVVGAIGAVIERTMLSRLRSLDPIYGLLLTFGLSLMVEGMFRYWFGSSSRPYPTPDAFRGIVTIGGAYIPVYRLWIMGASLVLCIATWFFVERTRLGAYLRSSTENAPLVQVFGINVPLLVTLTYAGAAGLAAIAGVLAAPVFYVSPQMGSESSNPGFRRGRDRRDGVDPRCDRRRLLAGNDRGPDEDRLSRRVLRGDLRRDGDRHSGAAEPLRGQGGLT